MTRRYDTITQPRYAPKVIIQLPFAIPLTTRSPPLKTNRAKSDQRLEIVTSTNPPKVNPQARVIGGSEGIPGFRRKIGPECLPTVFDEVPACG
jgi:hypothetical protein